MSKVDRYISNEFNSIIKDSREYKAYELGWAAGCHYLYNYIKSTNGAETAKYVFEHILNSTERTGEYFRKLVKLEEESNSKADDLLDKLERYKDIE